MLLRVKRLYADAQLPTRTYETDSGWDAYCYLFRWSEFPRETIYPQTVRSFSLGIAVQPPEGYEVQVRPRSSALRLRGLHIALGTVDNGYRGELTIVAANLTTFPVDVYHGDRLVQLVVAPVPKVELLAVDELDWTPRGTCGFGSSGR